MRVLVMLLVLLVLLAPDASAQSRWSIEIYTGTSFKAPTTLHNAQEGHPDVTIGNVRYETRPWSAFESLALLTMNYYSVRVGYVVDDARDDVRFGVEAELLHDKAYYLSGDDPGGVVQHFELSDGINYLLLNGAATFPIAADDAHPSGRGQLVARAGVGPVVTKAAATIRGQEYGDDLQGRLYGYDLSGAGVAAGLQARWLIEPWLTLGVEAKASYAATRSRIANGSAGTSLPTVHVTFGVGFLP